MAFNLLGFVCIVLLSTIFFVIFRTAKPVWENIHPIVIGFVYVVTVAVLGSLYNIVYYPEMSWEMIISCYFQIGLVAILFAPFFDEYFFNTVMPQSNHSKNTRNST